jgi:hypothetical protein
LLCRGARESKSHFFHFFSGTKEHFIPRISKLSGFLSYYVIDAGKAARVIANPLSLGVEMIETTIAHHNVAFTDLDSEVFNAFVVTELTANAPADTLSSSFNSLT